VNGAGGNLDDRAGGHEAQGTSRALFIAATAEPVSDLLDRVGLDVSLALAGATGVG
jgi:hypothetical protein